MAALEIGRAVLAFQRQVRGAPPPGELIVLDGKEPNHTRGQRVLTAVTVPGQHYLGSEMVAAKSNELPAARDLFARLRLVATPPVAFPPEGATTLARTHERNKSRTQTRTIRTARITPEHAGFPLAAQAARLRREVDGRAAETVVRITSLPPAQLSAARWLERNRQHWGIENGLHARLDGSRRDDQCRPEKSQRRVGHGIFARLANRLLMEWRCHQPKPAHKSTTDFTARMAADHARRVLLTVTARRHNLRAPS